MLTILDLLKQCDEAGLHNGLLTLRQLIPVHKSLIQCIDDPKSQDILASQAQTKLEIGTETLVLPFAWASDAEQLACHQVLLPSKEGGNEHGGSLSDQHTDNGTSVRENARRLFVIQYLTHKVSGSSATSSTQEKQNTSLLALKDLLVPYLLRSTVLVEDLIIPLLELVEMTALDAVKSYKSNPELNELDHWNHLLQQCMANEDTSTSGVSRTSCRVLGSLNTALVTQATPTPLQEALVEALYDKLFEVLQVTLRCCTNVSSNQSETLMKSLSCLSKDLMPLITTDATEDSEKDHRKLLTSLHRPRIETFWRLLFTRYYQLIVKANNATSEEVEALHWRNSTTCRSVLVVLSSVLCPLLPGLIHYDMPVIVESSDGEELSTSLKLAPIEQPLLWDLIFTCLSQGKSLAFESSVSYRSASTRDGKSSQTDNSTTAIPMTAAWQSSAAALRKRAAYLLRTLVESPPSADKLSKNVRTPPLQWSKYIMCVETLNSESEQHLVDQIWDTVAGLLRLVDPSVGGQGDFGRGLLTWDWMSLLFSCVLSNEQTSIRKWGMYRFLKGHAGLSIIPGSNAAIQNPTNRAAGEVEKKDGPNKNKKQKKKKSRQAQVSNKHQSGQNATLEIVDPDFVLHVLLPSWDSLGVSMGYAMHVEDKGKVEREDMVPMMEKFLRAYIQSMYDSDCKENAAVKHDRVGTFWKAFWSPALISKLHIKTILFVYTTVSEELNDIAKKKNTSAEYMIPADESLLSTVTETYQNLFSTSMVLTHRIELLQALAIMLSHCKCPTTSTNRWTPKTVLHTLKLFSPKLFPLESEQWDFRQDPILIHVGKWVKRRLDVSAGELGATVASAFVRGDMLPLLAAWDPLVGSSSSEQGLGWAITLLCTLAAMEDSTQGAESANANVNDDEKPKTASELLWPAIHKGLAQAPAAVLPGGNAIARHVARALLLLDNGCRLRQLSGLGNGDLVVDRQTHQLLPPPPNVEAILSHSVTFLVHNLQKLLSVDDGPDSTGTGSGLRSNEAKLVSSTYSGLIYQLRILYSSFPSSIAISSSVNELLVSSVDALSKGGESSGGETVKNVALIYAAFSGGADPRESNGKGFDNCIAILKMIRSLELRGGSVPRSKVQTARSILQYAKWGATASLLPLMLETVGPDADKSRVDEVQVLLEELLDSADDAVDGAPPGALMPLFNSVLLAGKRWIDVSIDGARSTDIEKRDQIYGKNVRRVVNCLLTLMDECHVSNDTTYMLNELCSMLFHHKLLFDEYQRLTRNPDCETPIRGAFRSLIAKAGTQRPHVTKAVICRVTVGWLGNDEKEGIGKGSSLGLSAIPYREDILNLLLHKEVSVDEAASNQSARRQVDKSMALELPQHTDEHSVTRGFLLVFLSKLPEVETLHPDVLKQLLHFVILQLLERAAPTKSNKPSLIMKGTPNYCLKMRAWQALCNLSRFVTVEVAKQVCDFAFTCMREQTHNQIRYFLENFTIMCGRNHCTIFAEAFLTEISRRDLHLQHISSLMTIAGNWIVGRYKLEFFTSKSQVDARLSRVLASIIPWLSSTQGFSRAIAQLLVYALIPLAIPGVDERAKTITDNDGVTDTTDSDWFLLLLFKFLNENREMVRLRKKQEKFFDQYDADGLCTPEGVLNIPIDEGHEADPVHMVDAIKACLQEVYQEAHDQDKPAWKQVNEILEAERSEQPESPSAVVNIQRKIIPLDALNLAMEDLREQRLQNAAGRRRQQLVVCASLVDKVPNLGGLARTSEIFAADRLILPDLSVCKMDNFKGLSVGAGDWLEMEECREENLLPWLMKQKGKGYYIVGVEQTSSSLPLTEMEFPPDRPTVLLLGKEKEGIPVEFLSAVDQCVEIPQLGIIRSLNVHVSGAITIWEYTKQQLEKNLKA